MDFKLHAPYQPTGDQPQAIEALTRGVELGFHEQVMLGVTGSGKTFTMANIIQRLNRPTLVLAHNKTLAAQLCAEFREFFPENAVEYFVSYYDYYQPEAYIPHTDTYIEKDASTNDEIDRLRLSATCSLLERRDVIVVASVSCIYGLGEPDDFAKMMISLRPGMTMEMAELQRRLVEDHYARNDMAFERNNFRVRGDTIDIYPAYWRDKAIRVVVDSAVAVEPVIQAEEPAQAPAEEAPAEEKKSNLQITEKGVVAVQQFNIDIPKQKLVLDEPIKAFGSYQVKAKLGFEVSGTVYVSVFEEK